MYANFSEKHVRLYIEMTGNDRVVLECALAPVSYPISTLNYIYRYMYGIYLCNQFSSSRSLIRMFLCSTLVDTLNRIIRAIISEGNEKSETSSQILQDHNDIHNPHASRF